ARGNLDLNARENVSVVALAGGTAEVGAGGNISGTIIGIGSANVSGASVDATILSQHISTSGDVSAAQTGVAQGAAAAGTSRSIQPEDQAKVVASAQTEEDREKGKRSDLPVLTRTVGRVTVILPSQN